MKVLWIILVLVCTTQMSWGKGYIEEKLEKIDIKFSKTLLDLEFFDAFNLSLDYYYKVQPSYVDNYYSRTDQLAVRAKVDPSDLLLDNSPIYLNLSKGNKVTFISHHPTQKEAALDLPKSFFINKIPVTGEKALKHLEIGEFVSFKSDLKIVIGAKVAADQGWIVAGGSTYFVVSGEFEVRIFRMDDDKFKLQLIGLRQRSKVIDGKIQLLENLNLTGFKYVKKKIEKIISLTLTDIGISMSREEVFLVDYDIDLSDKSVNSAYDHIMKSFTNPALNTLDSKYHVASMQVLESSLENSIENNLTKMEKIYKEDVSNKAKIDDRRVHRNFMGQNNSRTLMSKFKIDLKLFSLQNDYIYRENHLQTKDEDDEKTFYYLPTISHYHEDSWFWSLNEESTMISLNNLFSSNKYKVPVDLLNTGLYFTHTDKKLSKSEVNHLRHVITQQLPKEIATKIRWGEWFKDKKREHARITYELYFNKESFKYIVDRPDAELEQMLAHFVLDNGIYVNSGTKQFYKRKCKTPTLRNSHRHDRLGQMAGIICYTAHNLKVIFQLGKSLKALYTLRKLSKTKFFKRVVLGALMTQIPTDRLEELVYFKMRWSAFDTPTLFFVYGDTSKTDLYDNILNIQSILNNHSFDWKLLQDSIDKKRKQ